MLDRVRVGRARLEIRQQRVVGDDLGATLSIDVGAGVRLHHASAAAVGEAQVHARLQDTGRGGPGDRHFAAGVGAELQVNLFGIRRARNRGLDPDLRRGQEQASGACGTHERPEVPSPGVNRASQARPRRSRTGRASPAAPRCTDRSTRRILTPAAAAAPRLHRANARPHAPDLAAAGPTIRAS